jgi:hypothetical protein
MTCLDSMLVIMGRLSPLIVWTRAAVFSKAAAQIMHPGFEFRPGTDIELRAGRDPQN